MALLIMAGVTAAGVGISTIILNQIKQAENVSEAVEATYKAESALEKSLYIVKKERRADHGLEDTVTLIHDEVTLDNVEVSVSNEVQDMEVDIKKDKTSQFDLFDPDEMKGLGQDVDAIYISWDNNPCNPVMGGEPSYEDCYGTGTEWVEVSWTGWDALGNWSDYTGKTLLSSVNLGWRSQICPRPDFGSRAKAVYEAKQCYIIGAKETIEPYPNYRVKAKALYSDVEGLEVKPVDLDGPAILDVYSRVIVKAIGKEGRTQQALQIDAPWKVPLSGILDFTLFSEEPIDK